MQVIRDTTVEITSISNPLRRKIIRDSKRRGSRGLSFSFTMGMIFTDARKENKR
jgi:hypothetical protein